MITPPDTLRRAEHATRMRLGVVVVAPVVALGLALEAITPGVGLLAATLAGLVATLAGLALYGAHARARAALAASAAAGRLAARLALGMGCLAVAAARRRARLPTRIPAAGVALTPRLLPRPRTARA